MGSGLVTTPDNYGAMGIQPTHPELLDLLAIHLMNNRWSVKQLIREIMTSRAYQLSSSYSVTNCIVDPDNKLHWRMNQRRLDAEAIRDSMLAVANVLYFSLLMALQLARASEVREGLISLSREVT